MAPPLRGSHAAAALAQNGIHDNQPDQGTVEHQLDIGEIFCAEFDEYAHATEQKAGNQHPKCAHILLMPERVFYPQITQIKIQNTQKYGFLLSHHEQINSSL